MPKLKNNQGFTLVELLVVIAIIGILSMLAVTATNLARGKAREAKVLHDTDQIFQAISVMANDTGVWPGHQPINEIASSSNKICSDGCAYGLASGQAGIAVTDGFFAGWTGPYMNIIPMDPWNHEYFFDTDYEVDNAGNAPCDGGIVPADCYLAVVIGSYGPDGTGNGLYNGDDIIKIIKR